VKKILPTLDFTETRFFANVSGSTIEEYAEVTRRFDDSPIDAIEINISCPKRQGRRRRVRQLSRHVREGGRGLPQGD
jgi:dihydroorotate dehydrogenase